jgi:arabinose-5-phosphate isomerase
MPVIDYFQEHVRALQFAARNAHTQQLNTLADIIQQHTGRLFFSGIGKNGHVAATAASTFCSVGCAAQYINPVDAMHGDLGALSAGDLLIAVSKSGETEELLVFLQQAVKKSVTVVLLHSRTGCAAAQIAHTAIYLPVHTECDDLKIMPTASIVIFAACLQSVACELAHRSALTLAQFVINHPGGSIGKLANSQ